VNRTRARAGATKSRGERSRLASRFTPLPQAALRRGEADRIAAREPEHALALARTIPDGWYRCQAMARIAAETPEPALIDKALAQARAYLQRRLSPNSPSFPGS
jgi:hypothetical protein